MITEIEGSHVNMISQPDAVADVILTALKAVTGGPTFSRYGRRLRVQSPGCAES